jgi:Integron cassette protein VCH_CASS1 chain
MALTVKEMEVLRAYLNGVMDRADDHADAVREITLALTGAILWRKDDDEPIKVMVHNGMTKNVLWVRINGTRYAFSYDHETVLIEMRKDSIQGDTLHTFSNSTSLSELYQIFKAL